MSYLVNKMVVVPTIAVVLIVSLAGCSHDESIQRSVAVSIGDVKYACSYEYSEKFEIKGDITKLLSAIAGGAAGIPIPLSGSRKDQSSQIKSQAEPQVEATVLKLTNACFNTEINVKKSEE